MTLQLLWAEYVGALGDKAYRYLQFCQHYRTCRDRQRHSMRQVHFAIALLTASHDDAPPEVSIAFHDRLLRGNRARKVLDS